MKKAIFPILTYLLIFSTQAHADLCNRATDFPRKVEPEIVNDMNFYQELFTDTTFHGSLRWNEIVLQCNRQRDTKGREVGKGTGASADNADKRLLKSRNLDPKVIRGHYNFVGLPIGSLLSFKYVYILSKKDSMWTMVIPYKPIFNEIVRNRVDFNNAHASKLYDASQVLNPSSNATVLSLKPSPEPITTTLCSTSTYFPGDKGKYDNMSLRKRDPANKFISLGKVEYEYSNGDKYSGCRVDKNRDLYWRWDPGSEKVVKVKPQDWILDNFVRTSESYWTIPGSFQVKLLLKGHNESTFPKSTLNLLQNGDHLTAHFATKFLRAHFNQMYKSNVFQINNFSTMTTDGSYWHEVGHAFGLDDEYGFVDAAAGAKSCKNSRFADQYPTSTYQMCEGGAKDKRTIYHYLAASRYITKQNECSNDNDCANGEYCDKGTLTIGKNQCVAKKGDNETCDLAGGGHQCKSEHCKLSRCYTPDSVAMGGTCFVNDACKEGKCSSPGGTKGTCVCKSDADCSSGKWCNAGLDLTKNSCLPLKNDNDTCDIAGGGHQCKSGHCKSSRCYTPNSVAMGGTCFVNDACKAGKCSSIGGTKGTCVCKTDSDCNAGQWCDAGLDLKINACRPKLAKGESCGKAMSIGNDHKCKSGKCSGFPKYTCK